MTMSHAMTRPSDPLQIPPIRKTALVLDFNCLYTHDLQRKRQKRWQDGFLRFHTFNKRVMVYDIPRNFIGDTHLKDVIDVNDGMEIRLDRGVLVEVGDALCSSQQDVSEILYKRRTTKAIGQSAAAYASPRDSCNHAGSLHILPRRPCLSPSQKFPRSSHITTPMRNTSPTQSRPKSLNDVLGPLQSATGRAAISNLSPHEKLHPNEDKGRYYKRQQKRQRIDGPANRGNESFVGVLPLPAIDNGELGSAYLDYHGTRKPGQTDAEDSSASELFGPEDREETALLRNPGTIPKTSSVFVKRSLNRKASMRQVRPCVNSIAADDGGMEKPINKLRFNTGKRKKLLYGEDFIPKPEIYHINKRSLDCLSLERNLTPETANLSKKPTNSLQSPAYAFQALNPPKNAANQDSQVSNTNSNNSLTNSVFNPLSSLEISVDTNLAHNSRALGSQDNCSLHRALSIETTIANSKTHSPASLRSASSLFKSERTPQATKNECRPTNSVSIQASGNLPWSLDRALEMPSPPPAQLNTPTSDAQQSISPIPLAEPPATPQGQDLLKISLTETLIPKARCAPAETSNADPRVALLRSRSIGGTPIVLATIQGFTSTAILEGGSTAKEDSGPWSRSAFDLFGYCDSGEGIENDGARKLVIGMGGSTRGQMGRDYDYD